jgi:hypothetical protein
MGNISKMLGAATGGAGVGTMAIPFMPEGTPWYGYLILYGLTIGLPAVLTYAFPANKPPV